MTPSWVETWPATTLPPTSLALHIKPMLQVGPVTFDGRSQKGAPDVGGWVAQLEFFVAEQDQLLEARGFIAAMQGGLNAFRIGVFDDRQAPSPGVPVIIGGIPHDDGALFEGGGGYSQSTIDVALAADVADGAVSLTVEIVTAGPLRRGMYFSLSDRLYIITSVPEVDGTTASFRFLPQFRASEPAGSAVEFGRPTVLMRLKDPMSGLIRLQRNYIGEFSLDLEESYIGL